MTDTMIAGFKPGIQHDLSIEDYFRIPLISQSGLKAFARSPGHYHWQQTHPRAPSPQMTFGSAVDCELFTPDLFDTMFVTPPASPDDLPVWCVLAPGGQSKAAKEARAEIAAAGKVPVKEEDFDIEGLKMTTASGKAWRARASGASGASGGAARVITSDVLFSVRQCVSAIRAYPLAEELLAGARYQVPIIAEIEGVMCKCLIDIMGCSAGGFHAGSRAGGLADLKTTENAAPEAFQWTIETYKYHWQAAMYLDMAEAAGLATSDTWRWLVVESEPPYAVEVSEPASASLIALGREQYREALRRYAWCEKEDSWPTSSYRPVVYDLPARAYR